MSTDSRHDGSATGRRAGHRHHEARGTRDDASALRLRERPRDAHGRPPCGGARAARAVQAVREVRRTGQARGVSGAREALSAARAACGVPARARRRGGAAGSPEGAGRGASGASPAPGRQGGFAAAPEAATGTRVRGGWARREPLRRLLPQALVVACLAGGTSAFVADDKEIHLSIDGAPRILHTFADDVSGLLADQKIVVGAHDIVAPAPRTPLSNGDEVVVRHGRPLRLTVDGAHRKVWTTAHTVDGALRALGVRPEGAYLSVSRSRRIGRDGLTLAVRTERTLRLAADGRTRTLRTNAATVGAALDEAGVRLHRHDRLSTAAGSFPRNGLTVTVTRVSVRHKVRAESIPYGVRRVPDASLPSGAEVVQRSGRTGTRRVTYATQTVNGVRHRPHRVAAQVVVRPRDAVVRVGPGGRAGGGRHWVQARDGDSTGYGDTGGADELDWNALARCESGGRPDAVDPSGTYGGLYQFDARTWRSLGGHGLPQNASRAEQTRLAKQLYARRGASPWPVCGARLR
ncbi:resuscitation-promoting factor [Streptomyces sp. TS71-3]|uniref:resuscitation-promoting factor n=1 Tax=Streptomyces sp. TS71-3 TaxID=2733862 RepID=UPI001B06E822|nr:resuscitation-promoting factor [Streptomyces sp. TS71-3]GHJ39672.1 hypothetical protein Sm713_52810 [Streptomyces sp. TS71-3]